jgi:hypothetical protein
MTRTMKKILRFNKYRRINHAGITVSRPRRGRIELGTPEAPNSIGTFDNAVDAWKAIDAIDLAEVEAEQVAA